MAIVQNVWISFLVVAHGIGAGLATDSVGQLSQVERCTGSDNQTCQSESDPDEIAALQVRHSEAKEFFFPNITLGGKACRDGKKVFIVRHAERAHGMAPLNACGWYRAWKYGNYFSFGKNKVDKIFAFDYRQSPWHNSAQRCAQTAHWVAAKTGQQVHFVNYCDHHNTQTSNIGKQCTDSHGSFESKTFSCKKTCHDAKLCQPTSTQAKVQDKMMADHLKSTDAKTILVVWEHGNIRELYKQLTGKELEKKHNKQEGLIQEWLDSDYDTLLLLYLQDGKVCQSDAGKSHIDASEHRSRLIHGWDTTKNGWQMNCRTCQSMNAEARHRDGCKGLTDAQIGGQNQHGDLAVPEC